MEQQARLFSAMRALAKDLKQLDQETYRQFDQDPYAPMVGLGDPSASLAFFGRDPGKDEVRVGAPFVGAGGKLIRHALQRAKGEPESSSEQALLDAGKDCFYMNTVPYKPINNKAWSMTVKKQFQPLMAELLVTQWKGRNIITLGKDALMWFAINGTKEERDRLETFWAQKDCFESSVEVVIGKRHFTLYPLPHPSPLNVKWYRFFPQLIDARLKLLHYGA